MEATIAALLLQFGPTLWTQAILIVVTIFVLSLLKGFAEDLVRYFKARMSDIGKGAMILWEGKLKMVKTIHFKDIEVFDEEEVLYIPIETWIESVKAYPKPREDQFSEDKWKRWDGRTDRRKRDHLGNREADS